MAKYRGSRRPLLYWVVLLVVLVAARFWADKPAGQPSPLGEGPHEVLRVVDGDTLLLTSRARVRLQGVDAPETVKQGSLVEPWGPEAASFLKESIGRAGGKVRLTFGDERVDQYDRHLAFVWVGDTMLNEELVRAGLARARLGYRYSGTMKKRLQAAEEEARAAGRGLWSR